MTRDWLVSPCTGAAEEFICTKKDDAACRARIAFAPHSLCSRRELET